jgi:ATP-dependent protease ClpP protease subunit
MIQFRLTDDGTLHLGIFGLLTGSGAEAAHRIAKARRVICHVDSLGGSAYLSSEIMGALVIHEATEAFLKNAASAAFDISRACQKVTIVPEGQVMIHRSMNSITGNRNHLQTAIDELARIDRVSELVFALRRVPPTVIEKMADGGDHYFNADQALAAGLVDAISADHPEWPTPPWCAELERQPATPDEKILLEILEALGPVTVADFGDFSRRIGLWFTRRVRGK